MVRGGARTLAVALVVAGCASGQSVFDMEVGMCFDDPSSQGEITDVPVVECSQPHDNEVFDIFDYTGSVYPGQGAINDEAISLCIETFQTYVGISYEESALEVFPITPTAEGWEEGDREIICSLYNLDFSKLVGSMMGAAR